MSYVCGEFASEKAHIAELMLWRKDSLAWMVAQWEQYAADGGESIKATRHPVARFIQAECEVTGDERDVVRAKDLSVACQNWCMRSGIKIENMNNIGRTIFRMSQEDQSRFVRKDVVRNGVRSYFYFGIKLLREQTAEEWTLENLPDAGVVGKPVIKVDGYPFPGEVRAVFVTKTGAVRYVVEATGADYAGMLHIFSPRQLAPAPTAETE